tara:strand:- start:182 stop:640 length:459 start_codon:yes stop_codon:yes gene_type:complete
MSKEFEKLTQLILVCMLLISVSCYLAYMSELKNKPNLTFLEFIGLNPFPSMKAIAIGMASNFVFGMIDNGGLWLGMDSLDPFLPGGPLTKAGYGNSFSDGLGAFLGTFCGIIIKNQFDPSDELSPPIWSEAIGIIIGCLVIIPIMKTITNKS